MWLNSPSPEMLGPLLGISMRDACTRAMAVALDMRFTAEAFEKGTKPDGRTDWVTEADLECQRIFVKLFTEQWVEPFGFGLIGEEEGLNIRCNIRGYRAYFVVDPIDGTSAYKRKQSSGFGPMCALVVDDQVVAVCVGDASTGELYYYRPGSDKTHRLVSLGLRKQAVELAIDETRALRTQYVLLRSLPSKHSRLVQEMVESDLFKDADMASGSIGLSMARLWKGEVGGCILRERVATPWDKTPVLGMCTRLGFEFWRINSHDRQVTVWPCFPPQERIEHSDVLELLVVHRSRRDELCAWTQGKDINFTSSLF